MIKLLSRAIPHEAILKSLTRRAAARAAVINRSAPTPIAPSRSEDLFESAAPPQSNPPTAPVDPLAGFVRKQLYTTIKEFKALSLTAETFTERYAHLTQTVDPQSLKKSGLTEKYNTLSDLYASLQENHEHLLYYTRTLESQVDDAPELQSSEQLMTALDHLYWMKGRYQENTRFFLWAATDFQQHPVSPPAPPHTALLLRVIGQSEDGIFRAIDLPSLTSDDQQIVYPTPADRLAAVKACLPRSSINATSPAVGGLLHSTIRSRHLSEPEKIAIIQGLARLKADINLPDRLGNTPLYVALENRQRQPLIVQALEELDARLPANEAPRVTAHLSGVGGPLPYPPQGPNKTTISLEGLSERIAEDGLDPVIRTILQQLTEDAPLAMRPPLDATLKAWATVRDYPSFIRTLESAQAAKPGHLAAPGVIMTGWGQPTGHAIGFVFNEEADGGYLYACNTGNLKDEDRSVVKYRVVDFEKLQSFFQAAARDRNRTRSFYIGPVAPWGLERCPEEEQLPLNVDRAKQKRGHCPMAARKACALALLWSTSREHDVDPALVKATYKDLTTELRREGAARATDSQSYELKGKTLVSLLTKLDRPGFEPLAYQLADTILRKHGSFLWRYWYKSSGHVPETHSSEYLATLRQALEATGQDVASIKTAKKEDLATHAEDRGHPKAAEILRALIGQAH